MTGVESVKYFLKEVRRRFGVFLSPNLWRERKGEVGWCSFAHGRASANHLGIINHLATLYQYKSYLEIGVRHREGNLDRVLVPSVVGVDPNPKSGADYVMTSDEFFNKHDDLEFDLIFIDGLHTGEQVAKDLANSINALRPGGTIVMHDLNPPSAEVAREDQNEGSERSWCGTSWRGFVEFRASRADLEMCVVDVDWGCGVVRRGSQDLYSGPWLEYSDLEANRHDALNLISIEEFLRIHPVSLRRKFAVAVFGI